MKLSIITVNLNNKEGLKKTFKSIISQTYKDYEWIVIDGGSTDGSKELIEEYRQYFSFWISESDKGVFNAMNKGLAHVSGEFVNFMNSGDVFYESTTLEKVFSEHLEGDMVYGNWLISKDGKMIFVQAPDNVTLDFFYEKNICHQAMFIKSLILKKEGYDENFRIVADWVRWIKMLLDGQTTQHIDHTICIYDKNNGLSSDPTNKLYILEKEKKQETFPPNIRTLVEIINHFKDIHHEIGKGNITVNHLIFLNWHPHYLKFLNFRIKMGERIRHLFQKK